MGRRRAQGLSLDRHHCGRGCPGRSHGGGHPQHDESDHAAGPVGAHRIPANDSRAAGIADRPPCPETLEKKAGASRPFCYPSYLKDRLTRARYATTLPSSMTRSVLVTSATRRSRNVRAATRTALAAASSQEFLLVPTISVTR